MPTFISKFLGKAPAKPPPPPKQKGILPASERAALIAQALELYRRRAGEMRGVVDAALKQLRDRPPNPNDTEALARLLGIHRAWRDLRRLMNHRERRYLVLAGLRAWLEQKPNRAPPGVKRLVVKR